MFFRPFAQRSESRRAGSQSWRPLMHWHVANAVQQACPANRFYALVAAELRKQAVIGDGNVHAAIVVRRRALATPWSMPRDSVNATAWSPSHRDVG